jgi:hypothetical protein
VRLLYKLYYINIWVRVEEFGGAVATIMLIHIYGYINRKMYNMMAIRNNVYHDIGLEVIRALIVIEKKNI